MLFYNISPFASLWEYLESKYFDRLNSYITEAFNLMSHFRTEDTVWPLFGGEEPIISDNHSELRDQHFYPFVNALAMGSEMIDYSFGKTRLEAVRSLFPTKGMPKDMSMTLDKFLTCKNMQFIEIYTLINYCYGKPCPLRDFAKKEHDAWQARTLLTNEGGEGKEEYLVTYEELEKRTMDIIGSRDLSKVPPDDLIFSDYLMPLGFLGFYLKSKD